jgi:hypothetical protein
MSADFRSAQYGSCSRAETFPRNIGRAITITSDRDRAPENQRARPSAPSAPSASTPKPNPANGFKTAPLRTVGEDADGTAQGDDPTVRANPLKPNAGNGADGADANLPAQSAPKKNGSARWSLRL